MICEVLTNRFAVYKQWIANCFPMWTIFDKVIKTEIL